DPGLGEHVRPGAAGHPGRAGRRDPHRDHVHRAGRARRLPDGQRRRHELRAHARPHRGQRDQLPDLQEQVMKTLKASAWYLMLTGLAAIVIVPLLWMLLTSLKTNVEATRIPPTFVPEEWTTRAYGTLAEGTSETPVLRWFLNSMVAATGQTLLVLVVASTAAYALSRLEFRGRGLLFGIIVGTLLVPGFVFLIPNFLIVDSLGWLDSPWALIVPGA